jgi:BolA protein
LGRKKQGNELLDFTSVPIDPITLSNFFSHIRHGAIMTIAQTVHDKLTAAFAPQALEVRDDSARHEGHAGATRADGSQGETHFHVRMVTGAFKGVSRVERQRRVFAVLDTELTGAIHALSLTLLAPEEAQDTR